MGSLETLGFVCFIRVLHGCRLVLLRSSGSSGCTLGVARFVWIRQDEPWESLGSFGFVWSVHVRTGGRCVRSGSSGSSGCALGFAVFFRARLVRPGAHLCSRLVRPGKPWVWLASYRLRLGSQVSFAFVWFVRVSPRSGSSEGVLNVVGFVQIRAIPLGAPRMSVGSFRFVWFVRVIPGCRWVRSGSSGSSGCALGFAGFVLDRSGAPWWSLGSFFAFGTSGFAPVVAGYVWVRLFRWVRVRFGLVRPYMP